MCQTNGRAHFSVILFFMNHMQVHLHGLEFKDTLQEHMFANYYDNVLHRISFNFPGALKMAHMARLEKKVCTPCL